MNKTVFFTLVMAMTSFLSPATGQVTIGSLDTPRATLDVKANLKDKSVPDGIIAPVVTRKALNSKESAYTSSQKASIVYVETLDGDASGQSVNVKSEGYYYFDGQIWLALNGLHIIEGVTAAEDHVFTIPNSMSYVPKGNGIEYYQSVDAWVSSKNYIVLPPGIWKVEFSLPIMVNDDVITKYDWLEGLAFFTTNSALTTYADKDLVSKGGIGLPHLLQTKKGYVERGFGWCFIENKTGANMTCYLGFGRINLNRDGSYYQNEWFGKSLTLFPAARTPYLYATRVGDEYLQNP